jgi:peptidoglycan/LPS O-acetylase OafA/YrhL
MRRVPELDGIRAIAAIAVIGLHAGNVSTAFRPPILMLWGAMAVDLFFVLSGYLITTIILAEGGSRGFLVNFYARRSLRTWPIYYLCLLAIAGVGVLAPRLYPIDGLPYFLTYTQNLPHYWGGEAPPFCLAFAHAWSLAVEEQFYLIWPALVLLAGRRRLIPLSLALTALAFAARAWWRLDSQLLVTRCDGLALGGLLAALLAGLEDRGAIRSRRLPHWFAGLIGASLLFLVPITLIFLGILPNRWGLKPGTSGVLFSLDVLAFNLLFTGVVGLCVCKSGHPALGSSGAARSATSAGSATACISSTAWSSAWPTGSRAGTSPGRPSCSRWPSRWAWPPCRGG